MEQVLLLLTFGGGAAKSSHGYLQLQHGRVYLPILVFQHVGAYPGSVLQNIPLDQNLKLLRGLQKQIALESIPSCVQL